MSRRRDDDPQTSEVRSRVQRHLRRLLTRTALGGAALGSMAAGPTGCGPVVCDPLPPPLECGTDQPSSFFAELIGTSARWQTRNDVLVVAVELTAFDEGGAIVFAEAPTVTGGTLAEAASVTVRQVAFAVLPDAGTDSVRVSVPLSCDGSADAYVFDLDVSGTPAEGEAVPVSIPSDA